MTWARTRAAAEGSHWLTERPTAPVTHIPQEHIILTSMARLARVIISHKNRIIEQLPDKCSSAENMGLERRMWRVTGLWLHTQLRCKSKFLKPAEEVLGCNLEHGPNASNVDISKYAKPHSFEIRDNSENFIHLLSITILTAILRRLERFQSKTLRIVTDAPWYVPNETIRKDLQIPSVKDEISRRSTQYSKRLSIHPNELTLNLQEPPRKRRLQIHLPIDLPTRFNM
jgi:hypothetical protein